MFSKFIFSFGLGIALLSCGKVGGYGGANISSISSLALGYGHSCIANSNAVWCWGYNGFGQVGSGDLKSYSTPRAVSALTGTVTQIAVGDNHTCALISGGVLCWGKNSSGQLGNNSTTSSAIPVQVSGLTSGVEAIAAGATESCAIVSGALKCWGGGTLVPASVSSLSSGVTQVSIGYLHKCVVQSGAAKCWGSNVYGQLGDGTTTDSSSPVSVSGLTSGVSKVSAAFSHTCALVDSAVKCWGGNGGGQLGDGTTNDSSSPVQVSSLTSSVTDISAGAIELPTTGGSIIGSHSCAVVAGAVKCWGANHKGQLGDSTTADRSSPTDVTGLSSGATKIATGGSVSLGAHTCSIVDSTVKCWGWNAFSQLGNGLNADSSVPVSISNP